jgi:diaminohydroxyphosphoribosylaminopyrimidine deaminase/5-amino-6-(5-phosphoribosylamino)uracil reductase
LSFDQKDRRFMQRAIALAEKGRGFAEPNPMVGAVIARDAGIVGEGHTQPYGGPHAEVVALQDAEDDARGATMYVTLEPCAHEGKTPPCAPKLVEAGLGRVVVAVQDPTPKTAGKGTKLLRDHGIEVATGLCRDEAVRQNAAFFKLAATGRPLVIAKWAMSADGVIATRTGSSRWISGEASRRLVHQVRGIVDCIVVGADTAIRDDPLLTCRGAERRRVAARLVLCGTRVPPPDGRLARSVDEAPVLIAFPDGSRPDGLDALLGARCQALPIPTSPEEASRVDLAALLEELGRRGMCNVLVEGGAETLGSFFDAGQVDRVMAFVVPTVIGGSRALSAVGGRGVARVGEAARLLLPEVRTVGDDVLLQGWVNDPLQWAPQQDLPPAG